MTKKRLLLGAHMSIAGGFEKTIERGESIGCTAIQIFTKSNRQWHANPITAVQADLFQAAWKKSPIASVIAHASYLINCAAPNAEIRAKSHKALVEELNRCHILGIKGLVLHPGTRGEMPLEQAVQQVATLINEAHEQTAKDTALYLEIMAGQGSSICATLQELAAVIQKVNDTSRIGVCIDTCHAFAAGYDLATPSGYKQFWQDFDAIIGKKYLKALHLNDSKKDLGSHVDRHEEIGEGKLGMRAFELIMNDGNLTDIPKILETPKDDLEDYAKNMRLLESLIK